MSRILASALVISWSGSGVACILYTFPGGLHGWQFWSAIIPASILGILGGPLCWLSKLAFWLVP